MAETPKRLGDYELVRRISDGAQAAVYEATAPNSAETVAIKVFKETGDTEDAEMRFRREADVLKELSHRNIVSYRESFSVHGDWDEPQNCLVMEFMEGDTLKDHMKKYPKGMPWEEAKQILEQCLEGLAYAYEKHGVTHRDLKPSNIFILADGQVRLFDFGIARMEGSETMTGSGACMGSFDYMAPDFAMSEDFAKPDDPPFRGDCLSDVFSMSICFYEMLSGRLPWRKYGERPELEYLAHWRADKPKSPSHSPIAFRVIRHLTGFIDRGLSIKRATRFGSFSEMLEALRALRPRIIMHKGKDEYQLLEGCDKGGFGEVYQAVRKSDQRAVAVKRLFSDRASRRFTKEAAILRKYNHPHLVEYIDFFQNISSAGHKQLFLVMEYLDGMPGWCLKRRLREAKGGMAITEVLELFRYYLEALQYLHENVNQIIHRDIKPGNLYAPMDSPLNAKILDLGVARDVAGTQTHGATPGTWDYMAPEFVTESCRGTPQSDIYALGLSMYEALTGGPAFPRSSKSGQQAAAEFVARATGAKKVVIECSHQIFKDYPALERIIRRSTHISAERRYPSALHMRMDIMHLLRDLGRVSEAELDEFPDPGSTAMDGDTAATEMQTQATMLDDNGQAEHQWQKWVAAERGKQRSRRRSIMVGLTVVAAAIVAAVIIGMQELKKRQPIAPEIEAPAPATPALETTSETPVEPTPEPEEESIWSKIIPDTEPEPPPHKAAEDKEPEINEADMKLTEELKRDLRMLRMRALVGSSYRAFYEDAAVRADNASLLLAQREYQKVRTSRDVVDEQMRLWQHIADNAITRFDSTKDGRFLSTARGALHAASFLYPEHNRADSFNAVLDGWAKSGSVEYRTVLPFPASKDLVPSVNPDGKPLKNKYLTSLLEGKAFSRSLAGMLPHTITVKMHASLSRGRTRDETFDMVLVPEASNGSSEGVTQPFYIAQTEMNFGVMRCYRDGAKRDLLGDSALSDRFSGTLGTKALRGSASPYVLGTASEAYEFCNWLSMRNGLAPAYSRNSNGWQADDKADGFRLAATSEWEYAARLGFDWHPAKGTTTWKSLEKQMSSDNTSDLVWFYYKNEPRKPTIAETTRYPLGMVDMCGNLGELATDSGTSVICGGSYNSRTASAVMPWGRKDYEDGDDVGFRIVLPIHSARLAESK